MEELYKGLRVKNIGALSNNVCTVGSPSVREQAYWGTRFVPAILVASLAASNVKWVQLKTLDTLNKTIAEGK